MDGAQLQALVNQGYAIAASVTGTPFALYHPKSALNPVGGTPVATLPVAISADNYRFKNALQPGKPLRQIVVDTSQTAAGDYLVSSEQTLFIADQSPLLPVQAIVCNAVLTFKTPAVVVDEPPGYVPDYDGDIADLETTYLQSWPASLLQGTKGEKGDVSLPGDVRNPWWNVMLPPFAGVAIVTDDVAYDANGTRYVVSSAELTTSGWRLTLMEADA